jgi:hypothetical protein
MANNLHHVETYETKDDKIGWRVTVGDNIISSDARQGYENEKDALQAFFGQFFGEWDETFLGLYQQWQGYAGTGYEPGVLAQEGVPVRIREDESAKATATLEERREEYLATDDLAEDHGDLGHRE